MLTGLSAGKDSYACKKIPHPNRTGPSGFSHDGALVQPSRLSPSPPSYDELDDEQSTTQDTPYRPWLNDDAHPPTQQPDPRPEPQTETHKSQPKLTRPNPNSLNLPLSVELDYQGLVQGSRLDPVVPLSHAFLL